MTSGSFSKIPDGMTNPKDPYGVKKVPTLSVIPPAAILHEGMVMQGGAAKYGPYNWRAKSVKAMIYIDATLRHLSAYVDGQDRDPESEQLHLAHARACLGILIDATEQKNLIDDRPAAGRAPDILARFDGNGGQEADGPVMCLAPSPGGHYICEQVAHSNELPHTSAGFTWF